MPHGIVGQVNGNDVRLVVAGAGEPRERGSFEDLDASVRRQVEILRNRLTPSAFNRAVLLAEPFSPANAVEAGFLDAVVPPAELPETARAIATAASTLDMAAHAASKLRARAATLTAMRIGTDAQYSIFAP